MSRFERISRAIQSEIPCEQFQLSNQTAHHNRAPELETHFDLLVVSKNFENLPRVKRQQRLLGLIQGEFQNGLHAFSIQAYTPEEYAKVKLFKPPSCAGADHEDADDDPVVFRNDA